MTSALNTALAVFTLCTLIQPRRRFYLTAHEWNYGNFEKTFKDFAAHSPCAIVKPSTETAAKYNVQVSLEEASVSMKGHHALLDINSGRNNRAHWRAIRTLPNNISIEEYFGKKSVVARAFLQPGKRILTLIRIMWEQLTKSHGMYAVVHIRKGDKINEFLALASAGTYLSKLLQICREVSQCPRTVFLMCDGKITCDEFRTKAGGRFRILDYSEGMKQVNDSWSRSSVLDREHDQHKFNSLPLWIREEAATEMVVSMFLAALADSVVCTYVSNICTLIALLRGGEVDRNGVYSVDDSLWAML
ncbi:hypothetical protein RvY_12234 [Ramazzottius varieornatus]|uniref:O-fucosyltransferase family protein n=1 Tax=Ramazzottius varieornatus TaxID=947166 RepID=A0A1D1VP85_RAMVA|nr:hypothetical protein RvY_12234 [Ramazzottius varieornatus]